MIECGPGFLKTAREGDIIAIFPSGALEHRRSNRVIRVDETMILCGLYIDLEGNPEGQRTRVEVFLCALNLGLTLGGSLLKVIPLIPPGEGTNVGSEGEFLFHFAAARRRRKSRPGAG